MRSIKSALNKIYKKIIIRKECEFIDWSNFKITKESHKHAINVRSAVTTRNYEILTGRC